jgi:hypothetical protein
MILGMVWVSVFGLPQPAGATWYLTHGSGTSIQDENDSSIVTSHNRKANGLEIKFELGVSSWVHFAVPTVYHKGEKFGARYVQVRYNMINGFDSGISEIHVYDGETLVKEFATGWFTPGWQTIRLDLGKVYYFSKGMGISVKIYSGYNAGYDSFIFSGAGADFVK